MAEQPTPRTNIVNEAIVTPKPHFRSASGMLQVISSYAEQCQELEVVFVDILVKFTIEAGEGYSLDTVGKWLNVPREGLSDLDYKALLRATVRMRRSHARIEDFYEVATLFDDRAYAAFGGSVFGVYIEARGRWGALDPEILFGLLDKSRQAGGEFSFCYQPDFEDGDALQFATGDIIETDIDSGFGNDAATEGGLFSEYLR